MIKYLTDDEINILPLIISKHAFKRNGKPFGLDRLFYLNLFLIIKRSLGIDLIEYFIRAILKLRLDNLSNNKQVHNLIKKMLNRHKQVIVGIDILRRTHCVVLVEDYFVGLFSQL